MMGNSFKQEVEHLLTLGYGPTLPAMQSLGYRHMCAHLEGDWELATATRQLIVDTRRYAKRQMTWFRRYADLQWFDLNQQDKLIGTISDYIDKSNK